MIVYPLVSRYPWIVGYIHVSKYPWIVGYLILFSIRIHGYLNSFGQLDISTFLVSGAGYLASQKGLDIQPSGYHISILGKVPGRIPGRVPGNLGATTVELEARGTVEGQHCYRVPGRVHGTVHGTVHEIVNGIIHGTIFLTMFGTIVQDYWNIE